MLQSYYVAYNEDADFALLKRRQLAIAFEPSFSLVKPNAKYLSISTSNIRNIRNRLFVYVREQVEQQRPSDCLIVSRLLSYRLCMS